MATEEDQRKVETLALTGGGAIVEALLRHGVDTVFGLPGAQTYALYDALYAARDRVRLFGARHEQTAGYMAYGYAKASGRPGVFTVVPGPGLLNASAALCTAHTACAPVLALTGQVPSGFIGKGRMHLHELPDQRGTMRSFIKGAERIGHPRYAPAMVTDALRRAVSGRPGAMALEMAWDVMGGTANVDFGPVPDMEALIDAPAADPEEVGRAADLIRRAKAPMIMVGGGALHAAAEIRELAERLGAPVAAHRSGRGIVPEDHPLGMTGYPASKLWRDTDLLIGIGTRLEMPYMRWSDMATPRPRPAEPKLVRIDIDAEEMTRVVPDVPVVGDSRRAVADLLSALEDDAGTRESRVGAARAAKAEAEAEMEERLQPQKGFLDAIRAVLPRDGFFIEELSQLGFASWAAFPVLAPRSYISAGAQGTLGFGFPTGLGVKAAFPDKPVVSVTGDGGFMFAAQELATAVEHRLGLVTIVTNNQGYENVRRDQATQFDGRVYKAAFGNPDFRQFAESFGAAYYRAETPDALRRALEAAFGDNDTPALVEIPLAPEAEASPWPFMHPQP